MKQPFFLLLLQIIAMEVYSQTFLNGSFENNTVTSCMINNISNSSFNSLMTDVKGIGLTETIDVFYDTDCPAFGYAKNGHYYTSVENNSSDPTQSTIISFKLADTLLVNMSYSFCYSDRGFLSIGSGPIVIGISNTDSTFGTLIYTSPLIDTTWTTRTVTFNAPIAARYVTAKYGAFNGGAVIDNFEKCSFNAIKEDTSFGNNFVIYPNPSTDFINIKSNIREKLKFNIYNALGQIVKSGILETNLTTISTNQLTEGIYSIELSSGNKVERKSFVVEK